ncbi:STE/STE20/YSK protein kinase [Aphelenchoides avenae]|nr:STE/STE20/YSK protein kinase [Aphelenchus avenae]
MDPLLVYSREERIGRGSFGEVYLGRQKQSGQRVAIKVIDFEKTSDEIADIEREVALLSQCRSPYVTQYFGAYLEKTRLWIVMEYMGGGSALDLVESGTLDEPTVAVILRQMLFGLQYLHERRIVHSDVKAANVLFSEQGNVKLADLGIAGQLIYRDESVSIAGSPYWMAPEVASSLALVFASDIWSFGITAIELATQRTPYSHLEPDQALFRIRNEPPPTLTGSNWSEAFKAFRPTATSLLEHKFVSDGHRNLVPLALLERSARYREAKRTAQNTTPSACNDATSQVTWTYPTLTSATVSPSPSLTVIQQSGHSSLTIPATSSSTLTLRRITPRCNASTY